MKNRKAKSAVVSNELVSLRRTRKKHTWGDIYRNSLARGDDHGYAAMLADQWEERQKKAKGQAV